MRKTVTFVASLILAAVAFHQAGAQRDALVRVRVVDSAGAPIANAEVAALRGLLTVVPGGPTDSLGRRSFTVPHGSDYEVVVRRIGSERSAPFSPGVTP